MLSFQQLTTPVTSDQMEAEILQRLSEIGFSSKGWQSGSPQLSIVKLLAWLGSRFTGYAQAIALGMLNETATGDFLKRFSLSVYQNKKKDPVPAQHSILVTVAQGQGPYVIDDLEEFQITDGTTVFKNRELNTLSSTAPIRMLFEAETAGSKGNAAPNTITKLVTTLAGVSVTNPDTDLVQVGADEESDPSLRLRNSTKWATLAIDMPADGYRNVALGVVGISRVAVDDQNPRGPGTADVYVADASGPASPTAQSDAQIAIDKRRSVTAKSSSLDSGVLVKLPANVTVFVGGTVYVQASYIKGAQDAVRAAVQAYVNSVDIGGEDLDGVHHGIASDGIEAAIRGVVGVKNVDLTTPLVDIHMNPFDIAIADVAALVAQAL